MEEARGIDMIIFDKTGTLTLGEFGVVASINADGWDEQQTLALAAAVEAIQGRGIKAESEGHTVHVDGPRLLEQLTVMPPQAIAEFEQRQSAEGRSVVYLLRDARVIAAFALADVVRPESKEAVARLHEMGVEVAMLTGDSLAVAESVGRELGIDQIFAEVPPEHKDQKVAELLPRFYAILSNAITSAYRCRQTEAKSVQQLGNERELVTTHEDEHILCACFRELIPTLKPEYADLIYKLDLAGGDSAQGAAQLGITPNNLKVRHRRARQALRRRLEESCRLCAKHGCLDCTCTADAPSAASV